MKVLCYCPQPLDGTAYWRVVSPFSRLRQLSSDFEVSFVEKVTTNSILEHDVLVLQRPFMDEQVSAMQTAKLLGRQVWCDWDDDILDVPSNNGRVFVYQRANLKQNVRALAQGADVVTVTCEALAKKFREAGARAVVIVPNALDPTLDLPPAQADRLPVRRIAWRGGDSHNKDLTQMGSAFPIVAQEFEGEAVWHFVGFNPWWLLEHFPSQSVMVHQWINDVVTFFKFMAQLRPSIMAVPLVDDAFNRCKSNISVVESAWLGAVPVAPRWLEGCDLPGVFTYDDDADFERVLRDAVSADDAELARRRDALRAAVEEKFSLDKVNMLRLLVLKRLAEMSSKEAGNAPAVSLAQ